MTLTWMQTDYFVWKEREFGKSSLTSTRAARVDANLRLIPLTAAVATTLVDIFTNFQQINYD